MIPPDFSRTLRYQAAAEPDTLLADLAELGRRSEAARARRTVWIWLLAIWLGGGVFVAFIPGLGGIAFFLIPSAVIWGLAIYWANRQILDERRRRLAVCLVRALACDVPPGGRIDLKVDFNVYNRAAYRQGSGPAGSYTATHYRLEWLRVAGALADGAALDFASCLVARRKVRRMTKGRTKVKETLHEELHLLLTPRRLPADAAEAWPGRVRSLPLPPGARLHAARAKRGCLRLQMRTERLNRVTGKSGAVEVGKDVDQRLFTRHNLLAPLLAAYAAFGACLRGALKWRAARRRAGSSSTTAAAGPRCFPVPSATSRSARSTPA